MDQERGKPRLLIVTRDRYPPFRVDLTELFSRWLTPRLDIEWVMRRGSLGPSEVATGCSGERFLVSRSGGVSWLWLQLRAGLRVTRGDLDLVQVRDAALSGALFSLASRLGRRPFVYWMSFPIAEGYHHRALHHTPRAAPLLRLARSVYGRLTAFLLYRVLLPRADHVFVQSERMKSDVAAKGIPPEQITAAPMGVSAAVHHPGAIAPIDDQRLEHRRVLVYVGSLDPERRVDVLVDALAGVLKNGFDTVLVIVGEASEDERRSLSRRAIERNVLKRLIFTGHLPLHQALAYARRADVCLAPFPTRPPHYLSATPTKLVEYLAMGRPVVASDHPDQRRVIEGSGAGLIVPATAEGFAAAIARLLAAPAEADAMGAKGPAWVADHRDYAAISETVAAVYDRLLKRGRR